VCKAFKVHKDLRGFRVQWGFKDLKAFREYKELREQVPRVLQEQHLR
jgi:hypothetical protein